MIAAILLIGLAAIVCVVALAATRPVEPPIRAPRVERPAEIVYIVSAPRMGLADLGITIPGQERLN